MSVKRLALQLALTATVIFASNTFAAGEPAVRISQAGEPETIYRWETDKCEDEFIPDSAARAYKREDGSINFIATHRENWIMTGKSLTELKPDCRAVLRTSELKSKDIGKLWIQATYTPDGKNIAALVSNDLSPERSEERRVGKQCLAKRCWVNRLIGAKSDDMGATFKLDNDGATSVATMDSSVEKTQERGQASGVFSTSNIVKSKDQYYAFFFLQDEKRQRAGNCLFRTNDPFKSDSWRGWDGKDFKVDLTKPDSAQTCEIVSTGQLASNVRSLSYVSEKSVWVAFFRARMKLAGDDKPKPGFYYSTSSDLIAWSKPGRLMQVPTLPRQDSNEEIMNYPSLIDPESKSRNFYTVDGRRPFLTYTVHHLKSGRGTMNRDIMYVPVSID